jgi:hypothetical integral membrane protein (TIGR02206 family)
MRNFFAYDYQGPSFQFLGTAHIIALSILVLLNLFLLRDRKKDEHARKRTRWIIAIVLWLNESAWHIWSIAFGAWNIQEHLPLHVCSSLIWLAGYMLIRKDETIYEFAYFMGISGALQALFTPDIGIYGFPHFRFFQTLISHGLLVTSAIYLTTVEGMRPTWKSMLRVIVVLNIYVVGVFGINSAIGSNYLFVNRKPPGPTLLDVLPEWPVYLLFMEAIGLVMFLLLYLPFIIKDWHGVKNPSSGGAK